MSFDKEKKLLSCPQVILELQTIFGASKTSLSPCAFTVLHASLEGTEARDFAGGVGQREVCLFFKPSKSIFQWNYQKEKSPIRKLVFLHCFYLSFMGHMATFPSVFKILAMFYLPFSGFNS